MSHFTLKRRAFVAPVAHSLIELSLASATVGELEGVRPVLRPAVLRWPLVHGKGDVEVHVAMI